MKFGQLNIFLHKSYKKCRGETSPRPFFKKIKSENIFGSIVKSFTQFIFIVRQVGGYRNILKLSCRALAFTLIKLFLKTKKRSETILSASFCTWFLKKNIFLVIFHWLAKFLCLAAFASWDIEQYIYCNCLLIRLWHHKFWN